MSTPFSFFFLLTDSICLTPFFSSKNKNLFSVPHFSWFLSYCSSAEVSSDSRPIFYSSLPLLMLIFIIISFALLQQSRMIFTELFLFNSCSYFSKITPKYFQAHSMYKNISGRFQPICNILIVRYFPFSQNPCFCWWR